MKRKPWKVPLASLNTSPLILPRGKENKPKEEKKKKQLKIKKPKETNASYLKKLGGVI